MVKFIGRFIMDEWVQPIPFFQFHCEHHGLVVNYMHSYDGILECPICVQINTYKNILEITDSQLETLDIIEHRNNGLTDEQIDQTNKLRFQRMDVEDKIRKLNRKL